MQANSITFLLVVIVLLLFANLIVVALLFDKRRGIIKKAESKARDILANNRIESAAYLKKTRDESQLLIDEAQYKVVAMDERVDRLKVADKEITQRLKYSREIIEGITDKSCQYAANVELLNERDLQSSQSYQDDRKVIKSKLKKLAINAIDGVKGVNSNVNIGKFVAISAKSDIAGALLLTTVEMLCAKINANNGHQALEKLAETIIAASALIKCIDSRAFINVEFKMLLEQRVEIEIHFKKAKQLAKEKQQELREQEREEKRARIEAERTRKEAENEERIKADAIAELEKKIAEESEAEKEKYLIELEKLKEELQDAHQRLERARSRAQETKQGHVYIISNIGSFGENVLKIGMTRRMEPMDRVKELGDASVPFIFDVHALIESDDAPNLESVLHKVFDHRRVNKVNKRKEFFSVTIDEIGEELQKLGINALINKVSSADEYYQSIKIDKVINKEVS